MIKREVNLFLVTKGIRAQEVNDYTRVKPTHNFNKNQPKFKVPGEDRTNEKTGRTKVELTTRPLV